MSTIRESSPFTPATTQINRTSASQSERPVTLPYLPELYQPSDQALDALLPIPPPNVEVPTKSEPAALSHPFMTALKSSQNRTTTWNSAGAYKSTLSPALDAFSSLSQSTDPSDISQLLSKSWHADPEVTLKIIWNLRSIHEGKSAREMFYRAFGWLYANHPRTAVANLRFLVESYVDAVKKEEITIGMPHGYWKDLLNIILLAATNELTETSTFNALNIKDGYGEMTPIHKHRKIRKTSVHKRKKMRLNEPTESEAAKPLDAKAVRLEKHVRWHNTITSKLKSDTSFRALYVTVARLFADALARDLGILREIAKEDTDAERRAALSYDLTLVGKWAPSIGGSHDRVTNIATAISELLYAGGQFPIPVTQHEQPLSQETAHKLRAAYARWVTSPLRRALQIPEVAMSARRWDQVKYTRVPSRCMHINKKLFSTHDPERFSQYLLDVAVGKKKISGATLLPNEMLREAYRLMGNKIESQVINAQWKTMVERVKESGKLDNAIAVCDVSGSMGYLSASTSATAPIFPSVALSLLLAQMAQPPWANTFITFSQTPEIVSVNPEDDLVTTAASMVRTAWGMSTDFNAVFVKLLLPLALEHKLKPEEMVKRIFVFSDMQFDDSRKNTGLSTRWETEHQIIKRKFEKAGYELPELVYWNLAGNVAKPVTKDDEGVALVSGFSPGMLKIFLEQGAPDVDVDEEDIEGNGEPAEKKKLDPVDTMLTALRRESFAGLQVFD
ncbi:hypothetical protein BU17DRAFT_45135 [Hysterangium stoloniferum]|nr:hypothetical protein BU17DRAFT_45135 [Hysterangium stoloniferum]